MARNALAMPSLVMPEFATNFYAAQDAAMQRNMEMERLRREEEDRAYQLNVERPYRIAQMERQQKLWKLEDEEREKLQENAEVEDWLLNQAYVINHATAPGPGREKAIDGATLPDGTPAPPKYKALLTAKVNDFHRERVESMSQLDGMLKSYTRKMWGLSRDQWPSFAAKLVEEFGPEPFEGVNMNPQTDQEFNNTRRVLSMMAGTTSQDINATLKGLGYEPKREGGGGTGGGAVSSKAIERALKRITDLQEMKNKALSGQIATPEDVANLRMAGIKDIQVGDKLPDAGNRPDWIAQIDREIRYHQSIVDSALGGEMGGAPLEGAAGQPGAAHESPNPALDDFFKMFQQEPPAGQGAGVSRLPDMEASAHGRQGGNALAVPMPETAPEQRDPLTANTESAMRGILGSAAKAAGFKVNLASILGATADKGTNAMVAAVKASPEVAEAVNQYAIRTNQDIGQAIIDLFTWAYSGGESGAERASRFRIE